MHPWDTAAPPGPVHLLKENRGGRRAPRHRGPHLTLLPGAWDISTRAGNLWLEATSTGLGLVPQRWAGTVPPNTHRDGSAALTARGTESGPGVLPATAEGPSHPTRPGPALPAAGCLIEDPPHTSTASAHRLSAQDPPTNTVSPEPRRGGPGGTDGSSEVVQDAKQRSLRPTARQAGPPTSGQLDREVLRPPAQPRRLVPPADWAEEAPAPLWNRKTEARRERGAPDRL